MSWIDEAKSSPDALLRHQYSPVNVVERYRDQLPDALRALPASILLVLPTISLLFVLTVATYFLQASSAAKVRAKSGRTGTQARRKAGGARTVLLLGPSDSGKTSIFSALVFGTVPRTHTSQHESEGHTIIGPPEPHPEQDATKGVTVGSSVPIHLIDLPGHARLRVRANDFLPAADGLVFCVDATLAARAATASAAQGAAAALSEAVEFFHTTLTALATQRLKSEASTAAPSLQVLFTRSDLSPLLSQASSSKDSSEAATQLAKRKAQLLQRAKAGFEAELARHRQALQVGRRGAAPKIGGIGEVQGGSGSSAGGGLINRLRSLLGLPPSSGSSGSAEKSGFDEGEEDEEDFDYVDWATLQRQQQTSLPIISLDRLDEEVVEGGKASFGLVSLGKERDWLGGSGSTREGKDDRDLRSFLASL